MKKNEDNTNKTDIFGNLTPLEFGNIFCGPEDERKAKCIHCGEEWYAIHFKDGVCNKCQEKKLPGATEVLRRNKQSNRIFLGIMTGLFLLFLYWFCK